MKTDKVLSISKDKFSQYFLSAQKGNHDSQYIVAVFYELGIGIDKNLKEANKWYLKSAIGGNSDAQNNLGFNYSNGNGVRQDFIQAYKWYVKSAKQGNVKAQAMLSIIYDIGEGVSRDLVQALKWGYIALSKNYSLVLDQIILLEEITSFAQKKEARKLSIEWLKNN